MAIVVSYIVGIVISYTFNDDQLKAYISKKSEKHRHHHHHDHHHESPTLVNKIKGTLDHAIDEFFSVTKFLIFGAFIAPSMQTYINTSTLLSLGNTKITAILIMILLAFILSLCSEADAFIASSFRGSFQTGPLIAFMVFGAMVDIKNLIMMSSTFKKQFVMTLIPLITLCVFVGALFI